MNWVRGSTKAFVGGKELSYLSDVGVIDWKPLLEYDYTQSYYNSRVSSHSVYKSVDLAGKIVVRVTLSNFKMTIAGLGGALCEVDVGQASYNHSNVNDYNKYEYTINFNPVTVIAVYQTSKFDTTLTANAMSDVSVFGTISMEYMI